MKTLLTLLVAMALCVITFKESLAKCEWNNRELLKATQGEGYFDHAERAYTSIVDRLSSTFPSDLGIIFSKTSSDFQVFLFELESGGQIDPIALRDSNGTVKNYAVIKITDYEVDLGSIITRLEGRVCEGRGLGSFTGTRQRDRERVVIEIH
ncbi:MAG: hypothetical protein O2985_07100, partial [Proteobacteria bacterium]|nr:hypothetical protein [Pseudomonadota bacterium]